MTDLDPVAAGIAELLEESGLPTERAHALAVQAAHLCRPVSPGLAWGRLFPSEVPGIWQRATRSGTRRLVLEIVAGADHREDDTGHVTVSVLETGRWPDWTDEHTRQQAATDILIHHQMPELDGYGLEPPIGWTPEDGDPDADPRLFRSRDPNELN
ncbi:hypothetical protein V3W47_17230 [Deinococcus sp. YIM 134068]|uniref:hypothetical protein n=1 Tax=Deinococcus lichenicola TaxID=3118910 RepID=UPI002F9548EF